MDYELAYYGKPDYDENWYRLRVDDATGELFYVHAWINVAYHGKTTDDESVTRLHEVSNRGDYARAVAKARELGLLPFAESATDGPTIAISNTEGQS